MHYISVVIITITSAIKNITIINYSASERYAVDLLNIMQFKLIFNTVCISLYVVLS